MNMGEVTLGGTPVGTDDYNPFWLPFQGRLFDGWQFLRSIPRNNPPIPMI